MLPQVLHQLRISLPHHMTLVATCLVYHLSHHPYARKRMEDTLIARADIFGEVGHSEDLFIHHPRVFLQHNLAPTVSHLFLPSHGQANGDVNGDAIAGHLDVVHSSSLIYLLTMRS